MSGARPGRGAAGARAAAPVRIVHLGLGNFFRAHQCSYTDQAPDASAWGIAAFTGRHSGPMLAELREQQGVYTLVSRGADGDRFELVASLSRALGANDHAAWLSYGRAPEVAAVTITITEAGYLRGPDGGLDAARPDFQADLAALRGDPLAPVRTAPARLLAVLAARRQTGGGPLALVPCDNLPGNGPALRRVIDEAAGLWDRGLSDWIGGSVAAVSTMVDRITPRATAADIAGVAAATGLGDRCPVVTEPFSEWVLAGSFPAGRPRWEAAGARFTDDVAPFEQRKLWLLNGGHSLLAYAGAARGHQTVAQALADDTCRAWLEQWWQEACAHLRQPDAELAAYRAALAARLANPRLQHRLGQIAADGSQKLPLRILPVVRAERAAGRLPAGALRVLAAWIAHLRGTGAPVSDLRADELVGLAAAPLQPGVARTLAALDPALGDDPALVAAVVDEVGCLLGAPAQRARR